jgi:DNA-binding CsgD family transcriptional regulator
MPTTRRMREPDIDAVLDLVGRVYEVALSPEGWDPFLAQLTEFFGGTATIFFVQDRRAAHLTFGRLSGLPEAALAEYESHFAAVDLGIDTLLALPAGSVITDATPPQEVYRKSEIYNDFRRRWGAERFVGGDVFRDARRFGVLSVQGAKRRGPFGEVEARLLGRLLPHVRRAVQMQAHLHGVHEVKRALEDVVEGLPVGVVILDGDGQVLHANMAARRIAEQQDGLRIAASRLRAAEASDDRALQQAIARALATTQGTGLHGGAVLSVRRPSGARAFPVLVNPGPGEGSTSPFRAASAVVLIGDPEAGLLSPVQLVAALYRLTPSEARLAQAVASGESLESYAEAHGIGVSTARWTMKQVLAKTGARRQADLVRMLLTGPAGATHRDDLARDR